MADGNPTIVPEEQTGYDRSGKSIHEQLDYVFEVLDKLSDAVGLDDEKDEPAGSADHPDENPGGPAAGNPPATPEQENQGTVTNS